MSGTELSRGARWARRLVDAEPAVQLALLRVVVPAMILITPELRHARQVAAAPPDLRVVPEGLGWFVAWLPIGPTAATVVQATCVLSALCAMVGVRARAALVVLTVTSFYVFALSQLAGAVWHDMHLLWMAALLAASPCDDALSFDRRGEPAVPDGTRYGLPLTFARLLLGCVYFFPGLHKLYTSGLAWALSDNLRNQLWWKWAEHGFVPSVRVDHWPLLLRASGLFVLAFELSFPVLAIVRRTRPWVALAGIAFHVLAAIFFRIPFVSLWAMYVVLVNPCRILRRKRATEPVAAVREPAARSTVLVGSLLVAGAFIQGARGQMRAYPFACYPTFEWILGTEMPDLILEADTVDGGHVIVPHAREANGYRTQRQWGQIFSLAGVSAPVDPERLRAYVAYVARTEPARSVLRRAVRVRVYVASVSVVPEERGLPPRRGQLLAEIPLGS